MVSISRQRETAFRKRKPRSDFKISGNASSRCLACHHSFDDCPLLPYHDDKGAYHQLPPAEEHTIVAGFSINWRKMERGVQVRAGKRFQIFKLRRQLLVYSVIILFYCTNNPRNFSAPPSFLPKRQCCRGVSMSCCSNQSSLR